VNRPAAHAVPSWPLLVLALPAAVAVWSGWVGIGRMTGFGQVHPLPGIWDGFHLDTAVTLPIGVEAYAAYALRAWLNTGPRVSTRTRRFARWSAIGSLIVGMAGQIAYHLLAQTNAHRAPWLITTAVACLPVLVLGMGATLAHLLHCDSPKAHTPLANMRTPPGTPPTAMEHVGQPPPSRDRLSLARATAASLNAAGQRVSRRSLRAAGIHGSNAELDTLARELS
jgi:hypothetical protein